MLKSRELTSEERCQIIILHKINMKMVDITRQMNMGESTIRGVIIRWDHSNKYNSAHRGGRPPKLGKEKPGD